MKLYLLAGKDGLQAETDLKIEGGTVSVKAGSGRARTIRAVNTESTKGIKRGASLSIKGGSITVNTLGSGSMGSGANVLNSGGMMAGGLTVYNSFTINGDQLSTSNLVRIADVITERVNENLGRMI